MNDNQKEFLNELGKLFDKYNIDVVRAGNENNDELGDVEFWSNNQKLAFHEYTGYKRDIIQRKRRNNYGRCNINGYKDVL